MKKRIYLDNASTTRVLPEVLEAMLPYYTEDYGNPAAIYTFAGEAKRGVDQARASAAKLIGARPEEIFFTSGGSESDNWALKAVAESCSGKGKHMIVSSIEHHAVLYTAKWLEKQGFAITYLPVDACGIVDPAKLEAAIRPDTILISVMAANNEIGTIEPLREIGAIAKAHGVLFHTDAVQAFGHIPLQVDEMHIDLLSASGHKLHGPKGVGLLYVRRTAKLPSFIHGGAQERGRRAGTLNVPGIVGMGKACEIAARDMEQNTSGELALRDRLIQRVLTEIPDVRLNGPKDLRLPNNANFCFAGIEGETLLILLDQKGICASSGSACASGSLDPSHVLLAIGVPKDLAQGSLRLTISEENTQEEIDETVEQLKEIVGRLRSFR